MSNEPWKETFVEQKVAYVLEQQGRCSSLRTSLRVCAKKLANVCLRQKPLNACNK
jgi:hypothetical protein